MRRNLVTVGVCFVLVCVASLGVPRHKSPKPGPLTGTWECTLHGSSRGDMPFTFYLEQFGEDVTGSFTSIIGSSSISSGTYKKKGLEIRIEAPDTEYVLTGKVNKDQLSGDWSTENEKGTWEGKKRTPSSK